MSQPVKLSDALVLDARVASEAQQRSIAGQVEFWARLGRSLELLLDGKKVLELSRTSGSKSLSELLDIVDSPKGRGMLKAYLESEPYPHYEAHATDSNLLVRIDEDGSRTAGHFLNRTFVPVSQARVPPPVEPSKESWRIVEGYVLNHDGTKVKARFRVADNFVPIGQAGSFIGFVPSSVGGEISKKAERRTRTKP
jgi:hypothetical protein